ncbi:helix-turn-helix domain-containing protein [Curtobacterium sp. MCPF17_050]|uniref:helix-turn-helix domain-containing protein n=1 Tax=Curtobacterium sp. MCPF17_050 TaxID=2175664 RepID=UPI000D8F2389|nr:helix-turn-helix domain-containing protein [Curtobacterium sp. MCPF17_050]WIB16276.1 helix-turn-helix domain-containing protein [Curtobacterium sp. MCPF17_050]
MSTKAFRWAREQTGLPGPQKFVLVMLGDYYNDEWSRAWPSLGRLADDTGYGKSTVERALRALREEGLIEVEAWVMNEGAQQMPNRYLLPLFRPRVRAAAEQPVLAFSYSSESGSMLYGDLVRVPGSNLCIEDGSLEG